MSARGLFVRIPVAQADEIDATCARLGMTKQALVRSMLESGLRNPSSKSGIADSGENSILSFDELVALLKVEPRLVRERVDAGDIPGRRFGLEWRFSHQAVMEWLSSSDAQAGRATGFGLPGDENAGRREDPS